MVGLIWTAGVLGILWALVKDVDPARQRHRTITACFQLQERIVGNFSSNFWLALIVVGAVLAAFGNVNFNVAREREKGERASAKAMGMLRSEITRNLARLSDLRKLLTAGQVMTASLETTAWNVVSTGGLLVQMDQDSLGHVTDVYHLVNQAETYRSEIVSRTTGITQALGGSRAVTQQYVGYLLTTLDELEPKLRFLLQKPLS